MLYLFAYNLKTCTCDKYEVCWVLPLKSPSEGLCVDSIGRRGRLQQSSIRVKLQWAGSGRLDHTLIKTFYTSWIFLLARRPDYLLPYKQAAARRTLCFCYILRWGFPLSTNFVARFVKVYNFRFPTEVPSWTENAELEKLVLSLHASHILPG